MRKLIPAIIVTVLLIGCATLDKVTEADVAREARRLNKSCPLKVDKLQTLVKVESKGKTFIYYYIISHDFNEQLSKIWNKMIPQLITSFPWEKIKIVAEEEAKARLCKGKPWRSMYSSGTAYHSFYTTEDGKHSFNFVISKGSCSDYKDKPQIVREIETLNHLCPFKLNDSMSLKRAQIKGANMIMDVEFHINADSIPDNEITAMLKGVGEEMQEDLEKLPLTSPYDALISNYYTKSGELLFSLTQKKQGK